MLSVSDIKKIRNMKIFESKYFNPILMCLCFLFGIYSIIFYGDRVVDNEWGIMLHNLIYDGILSIRTVDGVPVPNAFMPPLYPYFLYVVKKIFPTSDAYVFIIQFLQLNMYLFSIIILYRTLKIFYSKSISNLGSAIFGLYPLYIYSLSQVSSITLQVLLIVIFLYYFIRLFKFYKFKYLIIFSICSGLLILLRGEFFIFVIFSICFLLIKNRNLKILILSLFFIILTISPYLIRNLIIFDTIVITKSGGYNLLKGNNPQAKVEGKRMLGNEIRIAPEIEVDLKKLKASDKYDLYVDKIFLNQALKNIKKEPLRYIYLYFKKAISFILIDFESSYPNYYSVLNILPKLLISISALISMFYLASFRINLYNYFILYYFLNIGLFSFFFILPRYSLSLLPIQIILSMYLFKKLKLL